MLVSIKKWTGKARTLLLPRKGEGMRNQKGFVFFSVVLITMIATLVAGGTVIAVNRLAPAALTHLR